MKGRRCQRQKLLDVFLDPTFIDPYPNGRDNKVIGPPLNVIHHIDDKSASAAGRGSGRGAAGSASATPNFTPPDQCYPDTNIPLSTKKIKVGAFEESNRDATKYILNFLTGKLKYYPAGHVQRKQQVDHIESAFYDQGWRVDRAAVDSALEDMKELGRNAFDSNAFTQDLPIRVDRIKGEEVEKTMVKVGGKEPNGGSDPDSDSENDEGDDSSDDSGENDDDLDNEMFVSKTPNAKASGSRKFSPAFKQAVARLRNGRNNGNANGTSVSALHLVKY
jgi:hypothetical protein